MRICSSYVRLWLRAVITMLVISLASGEAPPCNSGVDNQCLPSSGVPAITPNQTADMIVLEEQCLSACLANVRFEVLAAPICIYILLVYYVQTLNSVHSNVFELLNGTITNSDTYSSATKHARH